MTGGAGPGLDPAPAASAAGAAQQELAAPAGDGLRLAAIVVQLALLLAVVRVFELENRTVFAVLGLAVGAFVVHASLQERHRLAFFAMLSAASVVFVFGFEAGAALLGVGLALIGVCHLPIAFRARIGVLLVLAAVLMWLRASTGLAGLPQLIGPVLGGMFMFRLALYLRAVRYREAPLGLSWSTAYLFMLPNVCYPLFPVVDYSTFAKNHFDTERFQIYERGVRFMVRGVVHLLVYRFVYYELALDGLYLNDLADVVRHVVSTFLLYVKISGQFHLIVGVLGLFGFRLPETNHLYFLASSPTDFWRRINIYWKDFMMKLVYYPSFFRLRRLGNVRAIVGATVAVFAATWLLHSYQYFWLKGSWLLSGRDVAFWGSFAILVLGATLWEVRPGRRRQGRTDRSWSLRRGVSTVITFMVIAVLWSLWNADSLPTWLFMWRQAGRSTTATWVLLLAAVGLGVVMSGFAWGAPTLVPAETAASSPGAMVRRGAGRMLALSCLLVLMIPSVQRLLPARMDEVEANLRGRGWSPASVAAAQVGYYEQLTAANNRGAVPWHAPERHDADWRAIFSERKDFLLESIIPSKQVRFLGATLTSNAEGMRDRERSLAKPPETYRIALFGPSDVMGWGVADSDVFKTLVEDGLDSIARSRGQRVEVLNFGKPATSLAQQVYRIEEEGLRYSPDLVIVTVHAFDLAAFEQTMRHVDELGYRVPDTALARVMARVGVGPGLHGDVANLRVVEEETDRLLFRRAQELAARAGATVAVLELRLPDVTFLGNLPTTRRAAAAVGIPLLDCTGIWDGRRATDYILSTTDGHPNAAGHRLIAGCLMDQLTRRASMLRVRPLIPPPR